VEGVKKGKLKWSLHTTTIYDAVEQGLADKIMGRTLTDAERQAWIDEEKANCGDDATWAQEYCCQAVDEATAFLTYELIESCELDNILRPLEQISGDLYVGMDVGRKKDLTVITLNEKCESVNYIRRLEILEKTPFHIQREILYYFLSHKTFRRACIDSTGLGMQLAEEAQLTFGKYRVEPINFTATVKEELAYGLLRSMQDRNTRIPSDLNLREDLHSVKKVVTGSGNIRFDVDADAADGHADRFWSVALANHAASSVDSLPIYITTRARRKSYERLQGY
jgi:phage FluMu gp28-like protein